METTFTKITTLAAEKINELKARSIWNKAVKEDALCFLKKIEEYNEYEGIDIAVLCDFGKIKKILLNGAEDFNEYSWGGCALIYDDEIKRHYLTPSEQKKYKGSTIGGVHILNIQSHALCQAANIVCRCVTESAKMALNK